MEFQVWFVKVNVTENGWILNFNFHKQLHI